MKRVLISGIAGFLGSHLARACLKEKWIVYGIDNLSTGRWSNIEGLEIQNVMIQDIVRLSHWNIEELSERSFDIIFNFACPASPPKYQLDPVQTMLTNVVGTDNLLKLAKRCDATFVQASTSEVYGDPLTVLQAESYFGNVDCNSIRACYDEGKRAAETLCCDYARQRHVDIKIARFFNTYGPMMDPDDGRVVSNFIVQALKRHPLTVYGDGLQTRSFCYVDDLIEAVMRLSTTEKGVIGPVNLGTQFEFTVLELAQIVLTLTRSPSSLIHKPLPQADPKQRRPDLSLAKELLDWEPKVDLQSGLAHTIAYFRKVLGVS